MCLCYSQCLALLLRVAVVVDISTRLSNDGCIPSYSNNNGSICFEAVSAFVLVLFCVLHIALSTFGPGAPTFRQSPFGAPVIRTESVILFPTTTLDGLESCMDEVVY